jgi:4-amino-4-deoxy-L-arabinose transferase-like glycosyltransferase
MTMGHSADRNKWRGGAHLPVLVVVLLLAFFLQTYRLGVQSFSSDEVHILDWSGASLPAFFDELMVLRNHVPLYYLFIRCWRLVGKDEFTLRFFSVLWGVAGVALLYRLGRFVAGRQVGLLGALLLAVSPFYTQYARELWMYMPATVLALAATWFLMRGWWGGRGMDGRAGDEHVGLPLWEGVITQGCLYWAGYVVCVVAAAYTFLMTLFIFLGQAFVCIWWRQRATESFRRWLLSSAIAGGFFLPWLVLIAATGGFTEATVGWIPYPRLVDPLLTFYVFTAGITAGWELWWTYLPLVIAGGAVGKLLIRRKTLERRGRMALAMFTSSIGLTLFLPALLSLRRPFYADRYLLPLVPFFLLLVAWGIVGDSRGSSLWKWILVGVLLVVAGWAHFNYHVQPFYQHDDWRGAAIFVANHERPGDALFIHSAFTAFAFRHYHARALWPPLYLAEEPSEEAISKVVAQAKGERLWLVSSISFRDLHSFVPRQRARWEEQAVAGNPVKAWMDGHYPILEQRLFRGVCVTLYELER